jgi:hypothetical protein
MFHDKNLPSRSTQAIAFLLRKSRSLPTLVPHVALPFAPHRLPCTLWFMPLPSLLHVAQLTKEISLLNRHLPSLWAALSPHVYAASLLDPPCICSCSVSASTLRMHCLHMSLRYSIILQLPCTSRLLPMHTTRLVAFDSPCTQLLFAFLQDVPTNFDTQHMPPIFGESS